MSSSETSQAESQQTLDLGPVSDPYRKTYMRNYLGPLLDDLLRPVYEQELSADEASSIPAVYEFHDLRSFSHALVSGSSEIGEWCPPTGLSDAAGLLQKRYAQLVTTDGLIGKQFENLAYGVTRLTHYRDPIDIVSEGMRTAVIVPLTVASQIKFVERGLPPRTIDASRFSYQDITDIMKRPSFDRILMRLTKGPNGFLGARSTTLNLSEEGFFSFGYSATNARQAPLSISKAYELVDGEVVDLSDAYHKLAHKRRVGFTHKGNNANGSDGCPVRHRFEDDEGNQKESLIVTSKEFLIGALEASKQNKDAAATASQVAQS